VTANNTGFVGRVCQESPVIVPHISQKGPIRVL
jgi:hypothetical protein